MIYLHASVALAYLLAEDRTPPEKLWREPLIASRLFEYELWNRIHARGLSGSHGEETRAVIGRMAFIELASQVLARAQEPFPLPLRTLDTMHLSSMLFICERGLKIELASYDGRMLAAARALWIPLFGL
jgi:hypothetical protein